ncbi:winged helix-turn-helix domain-containing protein [Pseudomonas lundensis]|uniref:winged helix-turn-helix domain-containing protein n=1 Tax=Serratia proteamaculans TaxID=28151 RepID=UPI0029827E44|nr:winged helix-turn-helix domain-containing protein [Serratia proteamaculans]MDW5502590.1 winged helix-turn-helix domain-containing protein [Serratia proteamaculans]MDW5507646.1 winged helix-turn-helix domain-containing protein [Pseudomonas lundensis]
MKYKINAFLVYDATEGSLKQDSDGKSDTQLTITANALLFFMIQNPGVITRDLVMQRVWDDNGLMSSNSNLNQYLSILRKAFRCYGIDNVIITVARGRLEIDPELVIEVIDDTMLHPLVHASENAPLAETASELTPTTVNSHDRYWGYAGTVISLLALALFGWSWANSGSLKPITLTPLAQEPFEVFSTDIMINPKMHDNYLSNFIAVKDKKKIKYDKGERFLFYYGDKLQSNGLGRTTLMHCAKHQDNAFSYCDNYFYYSWK